MRFLSLFICLFTSASALAQLNADFTASATQGCTSFTVNFKDISTGGVASWFWDFGNGQTSSLQNPTIIYTTGGKFTVRLIIKNATSQAYNEKANYITVFSTPVTKFSVYGPDSGCIALVTSFADASDLLNTTLASRLWSFGDGGTSSQKDPSYTYKTAGKFDVSLTLTTTQGCVSTYAIPAAVIAGNKPTAAFSASPLSGCASVIREFKNLSGPVTSSEWFFGDQSKSKDENPMHHYLDTGSLNVKLKVSNNGCFDSVKINNYMQVTGPVALYNKFLDCASKETINYRDISIDEKSRLWVFEQGQKATTKTVTHTFPKGIYTTKLIAYGATCNDTAYDILHIDTGNPVINVVPAKELYCRKDSILFIASGYDSVTTKAFAWNFRDGFSTGFAKNLDSIKYLYRQNGSFRPELYLKNNDNCVDTIRVTAAVNINGPIAEFKNDLKGCTNTSAKFIDGSMPGINAQITKWLWSYGDGTMSTAKEPFNYAYSFPGIYNANLFITDKDGCTDTITHQVQINDAPIVDAGKDSFACAGSSILLTAVGASNYSWQNTTDLSCTNCADPSATPQQPATYFVTGTTDGCSATDSVHVEVQTKQLVKVEQNIYAVCSGSNDSVMLNASGADNYSWSPSATLSNAFAANPVAFPSTNTTYTVTAKDNRNCFTDIATVDVIVSNKPSVVIADSIVHIMSGSTFTIPGSVGSDVTSYQWIPATGLSCTNCLNPTVTVRGNSKYTLAGVNKFGCADSATIRIFAACTSDGIFIPNTFSPNNDGTNDYFYPRSVADINIKSFNVFNRWGQLLFQNHNFPSNSAKYGWNGKYKNKLQASEVYIYIIELQCAGSKPFTKKGNITLIR